MRLSFAFLLATQASFAFTSIRSHATLRRTVAMEKTENEEEEKTTTVIETPPPLAEAGDDFIQKYIKPRDDWWATKEASDGPIDTIINSVPLPSYFYLLSSTVGAIAFVGCIFQLFYDNPPAPVLGVPLTTLVLVTSGPAFVFLFLVAIARGQKEADDDDARYNS